MLPKHMLPKQVLAEHDMKKVAWRGLGDTVVREFDSVFSAHKHTPKVKEREREK